MEIGTFARRGGQRLLGASLLACVASSGVCAAPTGLNTIPTADLIPFHQFTVAVQNGNPSTSDDPTLVAEPQPLAQVQFGLTSRLEGGVDLTPLHSASDYRPQANFKWLALAEDYRMPALAVGVEQLGPGFTPGYYAVVSRTVNYAAKQYQIFRAHHRNIKLRGRRVHAGVIRTSQGTFPLVGTDWELSDRFVFYSDWISGGPNAISLGGTYVLDSASSVTAALLVGNAEQRPNGLLVNYTRSFPW